MRGTRRDWHKSKKSSILALDGQARTHATVLARTVAGGLRAEHLWIRCQSGFEVDRQAVGVVSTSATYPLRYLATPTQAGHTCRDQKPTIAGRQTRLRQKGNDLGRSLVAIILCSPVLADIHTVRAGLGVQREALVCAGTRASYVISP